MLAEMSNKSFALLLASAFAATFAGVFLWPGAPTAQAAVAAPHPELIEASSEPVYYPGCNAVRAAGKAPLHSDEPGYRPEMDGDGDGVACEPHAGADDSAASRQSSRFSRRTRRH